MSSAINALVLEAFGHVGLDDPQGQPFGDGRLAHARLADQHGVVLRPPGKDLHHAADFLVAADHRIELALPGPLDQIDAVTLQGLELVFRRLVGHAALPRTACITFSSSLSVMALSFSTFLAFESTFVSASSRCSVETNSSFIASASRWAASSTLVQLAAELRRRPAGNLGEMAQLGLDDLVQLSAIGADALEDRPDDAVVFGQERRQQVQRIDLGMAPIGGQLLGACHGLLGLEGQFVESKCHSYWFPLPPGEG